MDKKGILGSLFIAIIFLIFSGISFYYWWTTSEPERCVSSGISEQFWHSGLFLIGVIFLILAVVIIYSACRPVTGCWGEVKDPEAFAKAMKEEKKNAKSKHKLSNKK